VTAAAPSAAAPERVARADGYIVLYGSDASLAAARMAVRAAGGMLVRENQRIGVATATSLSPRFAADLMRQEAIAGVARDKPVSRTAPTRRLKRDIVERLTAAERKAARPAVRRRSAAAGEPLASLHDHQWDMAMIHATANGSHAAQPGDPRVVVGIIDTGVDGTHPDIAPNFDAALSRNFTTDIPLVDGPCEVPSCVDPANVDENGHGTHVAGTIGAPINGIGMAGIAPNVKLVNLRAGQDSGYFFLQPSVDALVYAADIGVDVVNMSYFIDPWLYNCLDNPADSPEAQLEQRTIRVVTNRALDYAHRKGVTLIAAAGNEHTDTGHPTSDDISPDFPPGSEYHRDVDNSCLVMPTEGNNVVSVGSVGPTTMKADYSNWGTEQTVVTAPGGYFRDGLGTPIYRTVATQILSAYPLNVAMADGVLNPDGTPNTPFVVRDCQGSTCAYYQYIQGTSMASPHAVGVAALIVSEHGKKDKELGGLTMEPVKVEKFMVRSATEHPCPDPPLLDYTPVGRPASWNATCTGGAEFNSIWGHGIVDALRAVGVKVE
jgi:lantibiotic leader peptide-processing serine protease